MSGCYWGLLNLRSSSLDVIKTLNIRLRSSAYYAPNKLNEAQGPDKVEEIGTKKIKENVANFPELAYFKNTFQLVLRNNSFC